MLWPTKTLFFPLGVFVNHPVDGTDRRARFSRGMPCPRRATSQSTVVARPKARAQQREAEASQNGAHCAHSHSMIHESSKLLIYKELATVSPLFTVTFTVNLI